MINCPALSAAIGGRDGMDGSRAFWMTLPFWEAFQMRKVLMDLVDLWYSWNSIVSFHPITMRIEPLDSYLNCESSGYNYV